MPLSYRMLTIDGIQTGLLGLEELFSQLYAQGHHPDDPQTSTLIVNGTKQKNFIPKPALEGYMIVLTLEYQRYFRKRKSGKAIVARDYGSWRGFPREQIPWFPTISDELCDNCSACLDLCAREVFEQDGEGKIWVSEPFLCLVGCCFCKSVCEPKAILMPDQQILNNYRQTK